MRGFIILILATLTYTPYSEARVPASVVRMIAQIASVKTASSMKIRPSDPVLQYRLRQFEQQSILQQGPSDPSEAAIRLLEEINRHKDSPQNLTVENAIKIRSLFNNVVVDAELGSIPPGLPQCSSECREAGGLIERLRRDLDGTYSLEGTASQRDADAMIDLWSSDCRKGTIQVCIGTKSHSNEVNISCGAKSISLSPADGVTIKVGASQVLWASG